MCIVSPTRVAHVAADVHAKTEGRVIAIVQAMASVAAKDAFGVLSTIAMARGRALTSGLLDVGYEAAFIFTAAFGRACERQ